MKHKRISAILGLVVSFGIGVVAAAAQTNSYQQTNLASDMAGVANNTDPKLINPWGISFFPGQPFWVADNNSGYSTIYDANGVSQFSVLIPAPPGDASPSTPTGTVINQTSGFLVNGHPSQFLFDSEDGTISGWYNSGNAVLLVDRSTTGAVYKGLAMVANASGSFLLATNFNSGQIDVFDSNLNLVTLAGSFTDPTLPAGYAPFGIQPIGAQVFVTYALQDAAKHDPVSGASDGYVSIFDVNGNFVNRFASAGTLNAPWGLVQASANFGMFSNDILIGNFGDGTINAFDNNGNFLGQLKDQTGAVITNGSLWALVFGAGGTGDPNTLYFTAGLANEGHGLFGALAAATQGTEDFSFAASPQSGTVAAGGSMNFTLSVTPANGFSNLVTFSCTAPTGITCTFNPTSVTPAGGAATTTLTATAASATGTNPYVAHKVMGMAFTGLGIFGCFFFAAGAGASRRRLLSLVLGGFTSLLIAGTLLASTGCGSSSSASQMNPTPASIVVTATAGALTHTTTITLTVQ
ncbi:MAG: TIGR03118 family protein [Terriglobales bacterium]